VNAVNKQKNQTKVVQNRMAYSKEEKKKIIEDVCFQIAENGLSLRQALKQDGKPQMSTWASWVNGSDEESKQYAREYTNAMEQRAELIFEDILNIADSNENDVTETEDGREVINHNVINRDRLRVDARKWILSKMIPKKFGDKLELDAKIETIKPLKLVSPSEP
jgi:hypothetical protein